MHSENPGSRRLPPPGKGAGQVRDYPMLSDIRPLLTDEIEHVIDGRRDIYGQLLIDSQATRHAARIVYMQGKLIGPASREPIGDAKATVWLLNHPRPIDTGDLFNLPNGETLRVTAAEHRIEGSYTITKVFLS